MAWSFPMGRLFGTEMRVHVSFFIVLAWLGLAAWQQGGASEALESIAFILTIFACVVAHEYGHALMARHYGIRTIDITLLPIGGLARLERLPEEPRQEIAVALAGPAVNFAIAAVLILLLGTSFEPSAMSEIQNPTFDFFARVAGVNVFIAMFNLVPAFPMDGGRVLRALLAMRLPRMVATRYAAVAGQSFAFFFGFLGLAIGNPLLVFVAIFVYLAATAESSDLALTEVTSRMRVEDGMITEFATLSPQSTLDEASAALIRTTQLEFPIVDSLGRLEGFLTRPALFKALSQGDRTATVSRFMDKDVPTVMEGSRLGVALDAMRRGSTRAVGVVNRDGRLVAYITPENLGELMVVRRPDT